MDTADGIGSRNIPDAEYRQEKQKTQRNWEEAVEQGRNASRRGAPATPEKTVPADVTVFRNRVNLQRSRLCHREAP